jgi:hypothetical membrane protein
LLAARVRAVVASNTFARVGAGAGVAAVVVSLAGILAAVASAPWFSWTANALSDLGVAGGHTETLFNYALLAGGVLGVPYAAWVAASARSRFGTAAGVVFAAASVCLAGVGAFPSDTSLHAPAAIGFFLLLTYALALDGSAAVVAGARRRALGLWWGVLGHVTAWLLWAASGIEGLALPEMAGSLLLAAWVATTVRRRPRPPR